MIKKIKRYFKIKKELRKIKKENKNLSYAEKLVKNSCKWVKLYFHGEKNEFLIHKINFVELLQCGRFPNILYRFTEGMLSVLKEDAPEMPKCDLEKMADEEEVFIHELVKKSLVVPTYEELEAAARAQLKYSDDDPILFKTVIPEDFSKSLFLWYIADWEKDLKKKSADVISSVSEEQQNIGDTDQATTSKD